MADDDLSNLADQIANELGDDADGESTESTESEGTDAASDLLSALGEDDDDAGGDEADGGGDAASALLSALGSDDGDDDDAGGGDNSGGGGGGGGGSDDGVEPGKNRDRNLDLILDIPLRVTVELGRAKMIVSDLLNLGQGSVVELSKLAGEPMEVHVNDKLVAKGEAVVVNEKFGVRLTDIISQQERVEQLG